MALHSAQEKNFAFHHSLSILHKDDLTKDRKLSWKRLRQQGRVTLTFLRAAGILYADWETSKAYVLDLSFALAGIVHSNLYFQS